MKIYIGADHQGFRLKGKLVAYLKKHGYDVEDEGDNRLDPTDDFPEFAGRVATAVKASNAKDPRGILLCGSGQGMVMAANRFDGIYASLAWDIRSAKEARTDDNSNVLCLPAHRLKESEMQEIVVAWLSTEFSQVPRYARRLKMIDHL